jgi:hypothetical protein
MNTCLSTDAILAVGAALEWDVPNGLRHLENCEECRAQLEALRLTRAGFTDSEPVDATVVQRISAAVSSLAREERANAERRARWVMPVEGLLGGVTALIILVSSHVRIDSPGAAVLGFVLGAAMMTSGALIARNARMFQNGGAHA